MLIKEIKKQIMARLLFATIFLFNCCLASAQILIPLYKDTVPNSLPDTSVRESKKGKLYLNVTKPTIELFQPKVSNPQKTAVIICPGGSYGSLSYTNEGILIAEAFNKIGVSAFILKYRLPDARIMHNKSIGPLQDVLQAIKVIRMRAAEWGINPDNVGVAGFSAGGHLASSAGTHFKDPVIENKENINLRPAFLVLVYPVISMKDSLTHKKSRNNLLGLNPGPEMIEYFSNEMQVSADTPPTMLLHAQDDKVVSVLNSIRFYEALLNKNIKAEMHLFYIGNHGLWASADVKKNWFSLVQNWMERNDWIKKPYLY